MKKATLFLLCLVSCINLGCAKLQSLDSDEQLAAQIERLQSEAIDNQDTAAISIATDLNEM